MSQGNRKTAIDRATTAWGPEMPAEIRVLAKACDERGQNQAADALDIARSTVSELINARRGVSEYEDKLHRGLTALGYQMAVTPPAPADNDPRSTGPVPDLGEIEWREKDGAPLQRGRVVFLQQMCARHWAVVAQGEAGRVPLILRKEEGDASSMVTVLRAEPDAGRHLAALNLLGRSPHAGVERNTKILAEAALFFYSGAGAYL